MRRLVGPKYGLAMKDFCDAAPETHIEGNPCGQSYARLRSLPPVSTLWRVGDLI
jgi:hypothetical protein